MSSDASFQELMNRLRDGDDEAAARIFHRFASQLIGLARHRLDGMVRQKVDPEDVMQSVFKSFFRRHAEKPFELEGWDSLWSLLTIIALRKCGFRIRHFRTERRDVQLEVALESVGSDSKAGWEAIAREPTPVEAAMLAETVEQLFRGLETDYRRVVELSLQGYTPQEISPEVGLSTRSVYRLLNHVRKKLERLRDQTTDS